MISKTITAKNLDTGESEDRTLYFNLTKAEALEINLMENLEAVGRSNNPRKIIPVFKRIVKAAYGVRLPSNVFTKDEDETAWFLASDHYSELLISLLDQPNAEQAVSTFIRSMLDFDVENINKPDKPAPTRPAPQDYKPSAKEIAAAAKAKKEEAPVVVERQPLPSERHRVPVTPEEDFKTSPEYQEFLRRQAGEMNVAPAEVQKIEVHPAENAPSPIENYDPNKTANSPFQQG